MRLPRDLEARILAMAGQEALPAKISEEEFQAAVVSLAKRNGWLVYHTRDSRGSEAGFPDLVCVREVAVYAELKSATGKLTTAQQTWADALRDAEQTVYLWRPSQWEEIVKVLR